MKEELQQEPIGMPRGTTLRIDDGSGRLVHVLKGEVWLTEEGSAKDHVLVAGQSFRLERDGAAIVYSFRRSTLSLSAPQPKRVATLLQRLWTGLAAAARPNTLSY